jgi:uncharacterized membrane protein YqgA involved in biofilm formation
LNRAPAPLAWPRPAARAPPESATILTNYPDTITSESAAFAATLGWGVAAAAVPLAIVQGTVTVFGITVGSFLPDAQIAAITATGGILLLGLGFRLLRVRQIAVADLLPALVAAPAITAIVGGVARWRR